MTNGQLMIENGRVSSLFKIIASVVATLITAGILGVFISINSLKDSMADLNTSVVLLNNNLENSRDEHREFNRRITDLEKNN